MTPELKATIERLERLYDHYAAEDPRSDEMYNRFPVLIAALREQEAKFNKRAAEMYTDLNARDRRIDDLRLLCERLERENKKWYDAHADLLKRYRLHVGGLE